MTTHRRALLSGATATLAAGSTLASPRPGRAATPLRVGTWATGIQLALFELIRERKLFEKYGLQAEIVRFADVNGNTLALTTDRIDAAFSVSAAGAMGMGAEKRPVRIVLPTQSADGRLVVRKPEIRSIDDLRGKAIGMAPRGSAGYAYTTLFLARNKGLEVSAYRPIGGGEARLVQLLTQGEIDAALLREVSFVQFKDRLGLRSLADQREEWARIAGANAEPPLGVAVMQASLIRDRREEAVRCLAACLDAIRTGSAEPALVTGVMTRTLRLSEEEANAYASTWSVAFRGTFTDNDLESLKTAARLFEAEKSISGPVPADAFDPSVYREAASLLKP